MQDFNNHSFPKKELSHRLYINKKKFFLRTSLLLVILLILAMNAFLKNHQ
ncbi:MAG: hypothetical protein WCO58_01930 [bacterium]